MGDKTRGLYPDGKFVVQRKDGTDAPGGKHDGCEYFVLDLSHDQHAIPAVRAYATSARRGGYELLANDLEALVGVAQDTESLSELRSAAQYALDNIQGIMNGTDIPSTAIRDRLRAALNPSHLQKETQ